MEPGTQLKFHSIQSLVDSSFFTRLSERKLTEYMLDTSTRTIHGFMPSAASLTKFNDMPRINLDYNSFGDAEDCSSTRTVEGKLYNCNTIEEFKNLDKKALLQEWGGKLRQADKFEEKFLLLTFADLKKYRFYYWLAFPVLHSVWTVKKYRAGCDNEEKLKEICGKTKEQFFQIDKESDSAMTQDFTQENTFVFADSCLSADRWPSVQLKNHLYFLAARGFSNIELVVYRNDGSTYTVELEVSGFDPSKEPLVSGWEKTAGGKLGPKMADVGALIDPRQLADQAVDLNLKLMKWRVAPQLDLDVIKQQKVLLLGAGTLGSYVARALMAWGVRDITLVDSGRVSYSNPVRQPLFAFQDCFGDNNQGVFKAPRASAALREIFPGVTSTGHVLEVPMVGHPVSNESASKRNFEQLEQLFQSHDAVFLLMDSRESRWLPTLMGVATNKPVINAALGFDSYLVMRHSPSDMDARLGCYYCNDVVAPTDSLSDRTLDQMCTVTRPGGALMASALAVELYVSMLQHPLQHRAPADEKSKFGEVPHQIRGYLHNFAQTKLKTPAYQHCSGCSSLVVEKYRTEGWEFVKQCLNSTEYLEETCGLKQVQEEAERASEALMEEMMSDWEEDED